MPRADALLVTNCGQLLTLRGPAHPRAGSDMTELGLIRHGAVLMVGGSVRVVGTEARVGRAPEARRAVRVDAQGRVVMPGFVDSHTHALYPAPRVEEYAARIGGASYETIARAGGGIQASARRLRLTSEAALRRHLQRVLPLFLQHGTTTVEVKSGYGLDPQQEEKMLRAISSTDARLPLDVIPTLLIQDIPERMKHRRADLLTHVTSRLIPAVARRRLATFCDVFCDHGYFSVPEARAILTAAARAGLQLKMHAEQLHHSGAARLAAELHAVSIEHADHVTSADIRRLRRAGTIATLLPGSNFHLGWATYAPARALIAGHVPVALATNFNPGTSPTVNMQIILSLACSQMRMSPAEAVTAATINGAYAAGVGDRVGSLEAGKQGDLIIMDVSDYREIPYYFGMNHCRTVVKKGHVVWERGMTSF